MNRELFEVFDISCIVVRFINNIVDSKEENMNIRLVFISEIKQTPVVSSDVKFFVASSTV